MTTTPEFELFALEEFIKLRSDLLRIQLEILNVESDSELNQCAAVKQIKRNFLHYLRKKLEDKINDLEIKIQEQNRRGCNGEGENTSPSNDQ